MTLHHLHLTGLPPQAPPRGPAHLPQPRPHPASFYRVGQDAGAFTMTQGDRGIRSIRFYPKICVVKHALYFSPYFYPIFLDHGRFFLLKLICPSFFSFSPFRGVFSFFRIGHLLIQLTAPIFYPIFLCVCHIFNCLFFKLLGFFKGSFELGVFVTNTGLAC